MFHLPIVCEACPRRYELLACLLAGGHKQEPPLPGQDTGPGLLHVNRDLLDANRELLLEIRDLVNAALASRPAPREPAGCLRDILTVLQHAGRRLTTGGILDAMSAAGLEWSESTVRHTLSSAVDTGILTNDQKANPRGYWLSD